MIPLDFQRAGQILDDDLYKHLVKKMPANVTVVVLMDSCHSGTALDLPFNICPTQSMSINEGSGMGLFPIVAAAGSTVMVNLVRLIDFADW